MSTAMKIRLGVVGVGNWATVCPYEGSPVIAAVWRSQRSTASESTLLAKPLQSMASPMLRRRCKSWLGRSHDDEEDYAINTCLLASGAGLTYSQKLGQQL
jgi:hypothetical protein